MKIYIGTDHAGFALKEELKRYLPELGLGYEVTDLGSFAMNPEDDYSDFVTLVAKEVAGDKESMGIVLGGSGQGEAMCANRISGVRALAFYGPREPMGVIDADGAESTDPFEVVKLAREHNDANIISIGTRFVPPDEAKFAIELFLSTKFSGDERHLRRINKF
ncbi:MAG: RpiB/LacA/LacB family sugar-phosphate isomerase [Candidatus Nomurabacteria bacterium]|nr:RpiB/LacA/LacB family sugar-phosphate isomerase [Candidatus Nomurabacteria bacterium]